MTSATGKQPTLQQLENHGSFIGRHIGPDQHDIDAMLDALGCSSLDALMDEVMPKSIRRSDAMALPQALNETEMLARLRELAQQNVVCHNMIGLGYHDTITPPVIKRSLLENPGWYTAYTPYQAEISQGRLQALLNYQQMVMDLTGMPLANASLLDEPSAAAEAMVMLQRVNKRNQSSRFLVADDVLPQTLAVLRTRAHYFAIEVISVSTRALLDEPELMADCFGVLLSYPGVDGGVADLRPLIEAAHSHNALVGVASDLLALVMLTPPGEMDADVVIGSSQRFGVQPGFGGPHAAFFATREDYARRVPGRIIGVSKDRLGQPALRMALQTREQHIRREKAMSNICTAQALLAIIAGFYAVYHGAGGLRTIAGRVHRLTQLLAVGLRAGGWKLRHLDFFDTLFIEVAGEQRAQIIADAAKLGINLRRDDASGIGISLNECSTREHVQKLWQVFAVTADIKLLDDAIDAVSLPAACKRQSDFLQHEVFCRYRSETELLRYLKRLENRDVSLTHSMISLGSCTMKLNAAAEMEAITWPEFAAIHPFAPNEQTRGYRALISELEDMLKTCTGYAAVSLQPNAGSQGEYAGLLAIRAWQQSRGEGQRDICLIPQSAHGTNPASAQMAGMRIVLIGCDSAGNIDVDELKAKAAKHSDELAALMITYPSTHGVFEERITEICDIVHEHGGQVYLDGANLNALVGWSAPGQFGADVSHLNLHKTFCIPHGGGGPGVGPVCVRQHLAEFLPAHPLQQELTGKLGPVSGTPWGSAGILPISWAYITLMGREGLRRATQVAILNANYLAKHINTSFKVLYSGRNNRIAHECIIDLRPCKQASGISEEDIAKRLIDYGFHAPTMSWPVPGTLMIEPTESEGKAELDRFISALHGVRNEIRMIEQGQLDKQDNPLKNAPLTVAEACSDDWPHGYSRSQAAWPADALQSAKYWPPVARVDNVHGDRNLVCSCPPLSDYAEPAPQALREAG